MYQHQIRGSNALKPHCSANVAEARKHRISCKKAILAAQ